MARTKKVAAADKRKVADESSTNDAKKPKTTDSEATTQETSTGDAANNRVLTSLLQGMSIDTFDAEYFEKKPLHLKKIKSCAGLFTRRLLLDVIAKESLRHSDDLTVTVYKDGSRQNFEPPEDDPLDGVASSEQVGNLLSTGYSVQFYQPQRYQKKICDINAALEAHYGCLAGASAYLTPPHAQALAPHHDDVDVFILQTQGSKHWKLYAPLVQLAGEHSNDLDPSILSDPTMEITLEEGDMLYFPRGVVHQASTSDTFSTHVTISIYHHNSWANFMEVALPQAKMLDHITDTDLHLAADVAALDFIKHRLPPTPHMIRKCHLKDNQSLRLRYKAHCRIVLQDDSVTLFHSVTNCRQHHMGQCTCGEDDDEDEEEDDELPPAAAAISFPLGCAPVLLHLYAAGDTSIADMIAANVADEDSVRAVIFRLIAEDMVERSK
ncbi:hypothetical protein DYB25_003792 [Aphanomyces astaci]|uniref:Bifunctional lysine-specific demethylase and histidyl-hydroxylase n=3 Tax=Aphanomyces astaci TaxID=112090 RepID=A0A397BM51_APHAT|nr:hypothetical protein DYB25_003792 [Aphanomyces astaci]